MNHDSYVYRKERLLKDFDRSLNRVNQMLVTRLGVEPARRLLCESREEYEALIPRIPFIGRNNPMLVFLLPTTRYLAVYRGLQRQGLAIEEAGPLAFEIGTEALKAIPSIARHFIRYLWFSPWFTVRLKKRTKESQERKYPGGYVLNYIEGDGQAFDYGVDYLECASCKFLEAENALELAPYVCAVDKTASELLGWGLKRTMTLAEGSRKCDFRFKKGGETHVAVPRSLQASIGRGSPLGD